MSRIIRGIDRSRPAVRLAVRAAVDELGYRPDPVLAALSDYRRHRRDRRSASSILLLQIARPVIEPLRSRQELIHADETIIASARAAGGELGLSVCYRTVANDAVDATLSDLVDRQRFDGLLLIGPQEPRRLQPATMRVLREASLACLALAPSLPDLPLTRLTIDHAAGMRQSWRHLWNDRGLRRIGCLLSDKTDANSGYQWVGSFLDLVRRHRPDEDPCRWLYQRRLPERSEQVPAFRRWWDDRRPEAVISRKSFRRTAELLDLRLPADVAYVNLGVRQPGAATSGILLDLSRLVVAGMRSLDGMIRSRQSGLDAEAQTIALPPVWHAGTTDGVGLGGMTTGA